MAFADGWAALNLEPTGRVPRTEYSADSHWDLVAAVTGIPVTYNSDAATKSRARAAFVGADGWSYDLMWSTLIGGTELGAFRTNMGHAEYADGAVDFDNDLRSAFTGPDDILAFDPLTQLPFVEHRELVQRFENHYRANHAAAPDAVTMTGVYITCVSGLIDMLGWDNLLLTAGSDPAGFGRFTDRYCQWIARYYAALAEADVPVVMMHDDIVWTTGPFIHPDWYRRHVFPHIKRCLAPIIESGKKVIFTADGDYTMFVDDLVDCGVQCFVMEPLTDMAYIAAKYGRTHGFIGNADTRILLSGSAADIRAEVDRCMGIGKPCPGFFMAVGNHIPANTPVESALIYNAAYLAQAARR